MEMRDVRRIAWHLFWRTTLASIVLGFVCGAVAGFLVGVVLGGFGVSIERIQLVATWAGMLAGLAVSFLALNFFLSRAIGKSIDGKRLELVSDGGAG